MPHYRQGRRRALGQHYLVDPIVVATVVRIAAIQKGERVLEIGTGRGALTRALVGLSARFEAFELDSDNYLATKKMGLHGLELRLGDAFAESREFDVLVSSLPYSESANFVGWLARQSYKRAVVLLQRDFVDKLLANPGDDIYRAISVVSQISSEVRVERDVPRGSFDPPPRVSSVIVSIRPKTSLPREDVLLLKSLFSQRRRKLGSALKQLGLGAWQIDPAPSAKRVQDLSPSEFHWLLGQSKVLV
jgi:16S rRNA (adenine1518-N6/adenine1519-N6)-dimethyltransferase